jgi:ribonucleoside-diphosphate reductase alpha chain
MAERFGDSTTRTRSGEHAVEPTRQHPLRRMQSTTRSFTVGEGKGYLTVACTEDGAPAEVLIRMAKQGSTLAGMMDAFSSTITQGLRHGVPLRAFVTDYVGMRFEPAGLTNDPEVKQASSVMDYVGRRLAVDYLPYDLRVELNVLTTEERATEEAIAGVGDAVWTDLVGLSMSAPLVARPRRS